MWRGRCTSPPGPLPLLGAAHAHRLRSIQWTKCSHAPAQGHVSCCQCRVHPVPIHRTQAQLLEWFWRKPEQRKHYVRTVLLQPIVIKEPDKCAWCLVNYYRDVCQVFLSMVILVVYLPSGECCIRSFTPSLRHLEQSRCGFITLVCEFTEFIRQLLLWFITLILIYWIHQVPTVRAPITSCWFSTIRPFKALPGHSGNENLVILCLFCSWRKALSVRRQACRCDAAGFFQVLTIGSGSSTHPDGWSGVIDLKWQHWMSLLMFSGESETLHYCAFCSWKRETWYFISGS